MIYFASFVFFLIFANLKLSDATFLFRPDYKFDASIGGWHKFCEIPVTWDEARDKCQMEGAVLLSPTTKAEVNFMASITTSLKIDVAIHTGVHASLAAGAFFSLSGGISLEKMPIKWAPKPKTRRTFGSIGKSMSFIKGELIDIAADVISPFICFKKKTEVEIVISKCGPDPEYKFEPLTGKCYKFHKKARAFGKAFLTCAAERGQLVIIKDEKEAKIIKKIFEKIPFDEIKATKYKFTALVGLTDFGESGVWFNILGDPIETGFSIFGKDQPNNLLKPDCKKCEDKCTGQSCMAIDRDTGELDDVWCDVPMPFICEKKPDDEPDCKPDDPDCKPVKPDCKPGDPDCKPVKPDCKPGDPDCKPDKPDCKPGDPDCKPDKPDCKPGDPGCKPDKPDCKPGDLDCKPVKPDCKPGDPDCKPDKPDCKPGDPDCKPDCKPGDPDCKPVKPDCKPGDPDCKPVKPDCKPGDPDCKPDKPDCKPGDPGCKPDKPDCKPGDAGCKPDKPDCKPGDPNCKPDCKPGDPDCKPVKPDCKPGDPDCKPDKPDCKPGDPGCKPDKPDCKPGDPSCKPEKPDCKPGDPDCKPDCKPGDPDCKPVKPDCKPGDPDCKPDKPDCKPGDPDCKPVKPDCKPGDPGCKPDKPDCKPGDPGCKPDKPDCKPGDPSCKPKDPCDDCPPKKPFKYRRSNTRVRG